MTQMAIGTNFNFNNGSLPQVAHLSGVTYGKTYTVAGHDEDGDAYFIDDDGDENFAAAGESEGGYGNGLKYVSIVKE